MKSSSPLQSRPRAVVYRLGQFWSGLTARVATREVSRASRILPPAAFALFTQLPTDAQRHCLNVLYRVQAGGAVEPALARAALLHDVGKIAADRAGVPIRLWMRGPLVLVQTLSPDLLLRWAQDDPGRGWRYALYVHLHHPAIGAKMAAEAGCDALTCWLIAHHQDREPGSEYPAESREWALLRRLQQADRLA